MGSSYPNPFNPTTTIPFTLFESDLPAGRPAKVTILILNVLQQQVAVPLAMDNPAGNGPLQDMLFTQPGNYRAFWDGTDKTGRKVASGIYYAVLVVNGRRDAPQKLVHMK
jgi:ABC-type dipeptide/oligopeptide/nickel transport system permease subunit